MGTQLSFFFLLAMYSTRLRCRRRYLQETLRPIPTWLLCARPSQRSEGFGGFGLADGRKGAYRSAWDFNECFALSTICSMPGLLLEFKLAVAVLSVVEAAMTIAFFKSKCPKLPSPWREAPVPPDTSQVWPGAIRMS